MPLTEALRSAEEVGLDAILIHCKILDEPRASLWAAVAQDEQISIEALLVREGAMSRRQLLQVLENYYFSPAIDVHAVVYDARLVRMLPSRLAKRHQALVVGVQGDTVCVAFARPDNEAALEAVTAVLQRKLRSFVALPGDLCEVIDAHYAKVAELVAQSEATHTEMGRGRAPAPAVQATAAAGPTPWASTATGPAPGVETARPLPAAARDEFDSAPAVSGQASQHAGRFDIEERLKQHAANATDIVEEMLSAAYSMDATDAHVEPGLGALGIRFRIDGILHHVASLPDALTPAVTSRLKVMSQMDIAERRMPQDGRFSMQRDGILVDLRVSSLPSQFGEKIVVRLLKKDMSLLDITKLQMPDAIRALHRDMIENPQGFFLVTGPTGSGKTTTLYATLAALDRESQNIVAIEDPIEYSLAGITQVQINEPAGLTFERALQSILRQDPDVVLVGEIRSNDTVEIACRAALTGHKVFSTLHTNDATQAVARLVDMGCVPYLITATLRGVLAQRLVRTICVPCKEAYVPSPTEIAVLGTDVPQLYRGLGCTECGFTGYRGRLAVFEYFRLEERYHRMVLERASSSALRNAARRDGMMTLGEYGKRAVLEGITTIAEVERCLLSEEAHERLCTGCKQLVSIEYANCPYCKTVLRESCPTCTRPVEANWEVCAHCGNEIERDWKQAYCTQCNAPQSPEWQACPYCGCETR